MTEISTKQMLIEEMGAEEYAKWETIVLQSFDFAPEQREEIMLDKLHSLDQYSGCDCANKPYSCAICRTQRRESQTGYNVIAPVYDPEDALPF